MKHALIIFCALAFSVQAALADGGTEKAEIKSSMVCHMCKETLFNGLMTLKGVKNIGFDLEANLITVKYKPEKVSLTEIKKQISLLGYDADELKADHGAHSKLPYCCQKQGHHNDHDEH